MKTSQPNTGCSIGRLPERIVCLSDETTETLYLLGEERRIVGISGFTQRPPQARKEKPRVATFTSANIDEILALQPDLVLGFSDLQADIAAELIRAGVQVLVFNQRSIGGILNMIVSLGHLVDAGKRANGLVAQLAAGVERVRRRTPAGSRRPRVYFEEWDSPLITAIGWVSELIGLAGGDDCFADRARFGDATRRIIADPAEVVARQPEIILGSWCGRRFRPEQLAERPGWAALPAVRDSMVFEVKSSHILQPGPAALTAGLERIQEIIAIWHARQQTRINVDHGVH